MKKGLLFVVAIAASGHLFSSEGPETVVAAVVESEDGNIVAQQEANSGSNDSVINPTETVQPEKDKQEVQTDDEKLVVAKPSKPCKYLAKLCPKALGHAISNSFNTQLQEHQTRTLLFVALASVGVWEAAKYAIENFAKKTDEDEEFPV